jgi:methyl-accepting chemotaxis protein
MSPFLIFILVIILGIAPLSYLIYRYRYRGTIIFKTTIAVLITNIIVSIASYSVGYFGINHIYWFLPVGYFALLAGSIILKKYVQKPVQHTTEAIRKLEKGNLNIQIDEEYKSVNDEIGQMNTALDKTISNLNETAEFARQIGEGNLDHEIVLLSESDHLRIALTEMRAKLQEAQKIQKEKRIDEEKRSWANEGLANLNEILRKQNDVEELSYQIISFLVNYINANQGGIFIRNKDDSENITLDLKAFYAFNRRKYIKKSFELGEGLVGSCAIEKKKNHLTEIPDNYIRITSGLGGSNPRSLILIPMKLEEEVLGVIEIASFNKYEDYQIEFLEQASLSIASSLNMAETNKRTSELLQKTQQQAEEMAAQEEEMRQNMEELQATQEESSRRAEDFEQQIIELQKTNEKLEGQLEKANAKIKELKKKSSKK